MGVMITISEEAKARADALVADGRFESVEQMIEAALDYFEDDEIDPDAEADALTDVSDEDREAIRRGLRDIREGRVLTADQVFEPILAELRAMAESAPQR